MKKKTIKRFKKTGLSKSVVALILGSSITASMVGSFFLTRHFAGQENSRDHELNNSLNVVEITERSIGLHEVKVARLDQLCIDEIMPDALFIRVRHQDAGIIDGSAVINSCDYPINTKFYSDECPGQVGIEPGQLFRENVFTLTLACSLPMNFTTRLKQ